MGIDWHESDTRLRLKTAAEGAGVLLTSRSLSIYVPCTTDRLDESELA